MIRNPELYIKDILEAIELIEKFMKNVSKEKFFKDKEKQYAVIRAIEIIDEATKQLTFHFKKRYPKVEWKGIAGMRDILIHAYFGVNLEKVWHAIKEEIPVLKIQIQQIIEVETKEKEH